QPVEIIRVAVTAAEFPHRVHAAHHAPGDFRRIVDDDGEALERLRPERAGDEAADLLEVRRGVARPGEYDGERLVAIGRIEQYPSQVQNLLGGARAAGEHHDTVGEAHERLEALLDVRHDRELRDDRIGRLGGDDSGLGDADI